MKFSKFILWPTSILVLIIGIFLLVPNAVALFAFRGDSFLAGEVWRIITFPFTHLDMNHLFENTIALVVASLLAYEVEMTPAQYMIAFGASLLTVAIADMIYFPALLIVGASSAIYAVYGAFAMKGSVFISRSWLVPILGATIWTKYLVGMFANQTVSNLMAQTLLHFLGFATGIAMMIVCLEVAKSTKQKVFS